MPLKPFKPFKALRRGRGTGAGMVGLDVARSRHGLGMGEARSLQRLVLSCNAMARALPRLVLGFKAWARPSNGFYSQNQLHMS